MSKKKEYPGMLLYFNRIEGIADRLNDQELGMIFRAMFNYARFGTEPDSLEDKYYLIWPLLKDMLDNDRTRYEDTCRTNAYNSACKNAKVNNQPKPDKEEFERQYNMVKKTNSPERLKEQEQNELRNKALNRLKEYNPNREQYMKEHDNGTSPDTIVEPAKTEEMAFEDLKSEKIRMLQEHIANSSR